MQDLRKVKFEDKELVCIDCDKRFIFSANEQRYYLSRGLIETKRCPSCRERRKLTLLPPEVKNG